MKRSLWFALLLASVPLASQAQISQLTPDEIHWLLIEEQLVRSLDSEHEAIVLQSLHNAMLFSIMYRDKINLSRVGDHIIKVHKKNKDLEVKQTALAALQVVGSGRALAHARQSTVVDRDLSRALALNVLENYFGNRYLIASPVPAQ